jgi:hypothetical protein
VKKKILQSTGLKKYFLSLFLLLYLPFPGMATSHFKNSETKLTCMYANTVMK